MNAKTIRSFGLSISIAFYVLSFSLLSTSCDPMKSVLISNQTNSDIRIEIVQDSNNQLALGTHSRTEIELAASGDSSETRLIYGLGVFSKEELKYFNSMVKEINIETDKDSCRISGDDLRPFLPRKRLGIFNNTIEIKIKNCPE